MLTFAGQLQKEMKLILFGLFCSVCLNRLQFSNPWDFLYEVVVSVTWLHFTQFMHVVLLLSCLICSHWSEPAEGPGGGIGDVHPGVPDPRPLGQLLDAPGPDPVPDVHQRHAALLRFPTGLGSGRQAWRAPHPLQVSAQRRSGEREQPATVLQHTGETLEQEGGPGEGYSFSQLLLVAIGPADSCQHGIHRLLTRASVVEVLQRVTERAASPDKIQVPSQLKHTKHG